MITLTFEPTNPEQAALLGKFLPEYMRAGELVVSGTAVDVAAVVERAAAAVEQEKPAKKSRAKKDDATGAQEPASTSTEAPAAPAPAQETAPAAAASAPAAPAAPAASSSAPVTLEQVRAKLADLSQAGKAGEVKALISAMGAAKLTEVPAEKYGELLEKAEAL